MPSYKTIAAENEALLTAGCYTAPNGDRVELADRVSAAEKGVRSYTPQSLHHLVAVEAKARHADQFRTVIEVTGESTTEATQRLVQEEQAVAVGALNFASARNAGGGYIRGARAQEEDLCRVSALYRTLLQAPDYYEAHRKVREPFYSHRVIYSPDVPVFRDDRYRLLDTPYEVSYLTSPAPNAGVIARDRPDRLGEVPGQLTARAGGVLAVAARHGLRTLVLGAWGCGVFRNDPHEVAEAFRAHLADGGAFADRFERVVFAVLDRSPAQVNLGAFREAFVPHVDSGPGRTT